MSERRITITSTNAKLEQRGLAILQAVQRAHLSQTMKQFLEHLLVTAQDKRDSAGFGGAMHDGGASQLEGEIEIYLAGLTSSVPTAWQRFEKEFNRKTDPQYELYLQLKQKFD